jgi:putative membrane protein
VATEPSASTPTLNNNQLATLRTAMASERTLMAWTRTSLSMYSFGFTIYKILEDLIKSEKSRHPQEPQQAGLLMVGLGATCMIIGCIEYWFRAKDMGLAEPKDLFRPSYCIGLLMAAGGVALFVAIANRFI